MIENSFPKYTSYFLPKDVVFPKTKQQKSNSKFRELFTDDKKTLTEAVPLFKPESRDISRDYLGIAVFIDRMTKREA